MPPHNGTPGIAGIAEVSRTKAHVPFDGSLRPPDTETDLDLSVTESEDECSPVNRHARHGREREGKGEEGDVSDRESERGSERGRERSSEKEGAISMEGDATLREWMKTAQVCTYVCVCVCERETH